ncbi:hypothetical protein BJ165DRAFT_1356046, partial [Panaeolus papilionaceus]
MHGSSVAYRNTCIPLVIGMPIMLISNLDIPGGAINGTMGTLKSVRYTTDEAGNRFLQSVIINSNSVTAPALPGLDKGDIACAQDHHKLNLTH